MSDKIDDQGIALLTNTLGALSLSPEKACELLKGLAGNAVQQLFNTTRGYGVFWNGGPNMTPRIYLGMYPADQEAQAWARCAQEIRTKVNDGLSIERTHGDKPVPFVPSGYVDKDVVRWFYQHKLDPGLRDIPGIYQVVRFLEITKVNQLPDEPLLREEMTACLTRIDAARLDGLEAARDPNPNGLFDRDNKGVEDDDGA